MDSILSKIYDGAYTPAAEEVQNEKMQELLAKYSGMEDFKAGFRLAVRLMLEGLGKEKVSFPG